MTARSLDMAASSAIVAGRKPRDDEIDVYGLTHPGKVRKSNQDHFVLGSLRKRMDIMLTSLPSANQLTLEDERLAFLAMVADGVGGSAKGGEASRLALEQVTQYVAQSTRVYYGADANETTFMNTLEEAALQIHADLLERGTQNPELRGMATTLTVFLAVWPWIYLLQVGDSRYYVYREGKLNQITRDQTMAQDLVEQGVLTRSDAMNSRWAHVLSSAIGGPQAAPVVTRIRSDWHIVHLLCSDGLTKEVSDDRIREKLATMTSAKQVCEDLLQEALDAGGSDNITIIAGRAIPKDPV
ncbi:MAG TPA: protein phosphatase 2C domain-containing protein [Gemmatimonadales bacterium]|nr:protein phosphatase 2C domain-containing protein [Gemmatimonadales bacterium]